MFQRLSQFILGFTLVLTTSVYAAPPSPVSDAELNRAGNRVFLSWTNPVEAGLSEIVVSSNGELLDRIPINAATNDEYTFLSEDLELIDVATRDVVLTVVNQTQETTPTTFTIDFQAQRIVSPSVEDSGAFWISTSNMATTWSIGVDDSAIQRVRLGVSEDPAAVTTDWTLVTTNISDKSVLIPSLNLTQGNTYYILVQALDTAGLWSNTGRSDGVLVDVTLPTVTELEFTEPGPYSSRQIITQRLGATIKQPFLEFEWTDGDPETTVVSRDYSIRTLPSETVVLDWTTVSGNVNPYTINIFNFQSGVTYSVGVRVKNGAGLYSDPVYSPGIKTDYSAPFVTYTVPEYSTDDDTLTFGWVLQDFDSGVVSSSYRLRRNDTDAVLIPYTSTSNFSVTNATFTGLPLENGVSYSVDILAENGAGVTSTVLVSSPTLVDFTDPVLSEITDEGIYKRTTTNLGVTFTTSDPETDIITVNYSLKQVSGDIELIPWTPTTSFTAITLTDLELENGVTYAIGIQSVNGAGTVSTQRFSDGIKTDVTSPSVVTLVDDGDFVHTQSTLNIYWTESEPDSEIVSRSYLVKETLSGSVVRDWAATSSTSSVLIAGLTLNSGTDYTVGLTVKNAVGMWSLPVFTDGIVVDQSPPPTPTVFDDGSFTRSTDSFLVTWSETDAESGITTMSYRLETTNDEIQVLDWVTVAASQNYTIPNLTLAEGVSYSVQLLLTNGAGMVSGMGESDGILIENSPPTLSALVDDGLYVSQNHTLTVQITAEDAHSDVHQARYTVIEHDSDGTTIDIVGLTPTTSVTSLDLTDLSLVQNTFYTVGVMVRNGVGMWSDIAYTDGVTVDVTAPSLNSVEDEGLYTPLESSLQITINYSEPESGLAGMQFRVIETDTDSEFIGWTNGTPTQSVILAGLGLSHGVTYSVGIRLLNGAGLWSGEVRSDGIHVDSLQPSLPVVSLSESFAVTTSRLTASWIPHEDDRLSEARYAIVSTTNGIVSSWIPTATTTATDVVLDGLSLTQGGTYYLAVSVANLAGTFSQPGFSSAVTVDITAPSTPTVSLSSGYVLADSTVTVSWTSTEPETDIVLAEYAIGTSSDNQTIRTWTTVVNTANEFAISDVAYEEGEAYTYFLRVTNQAGLVSDYGVSLEISADLSVPTISAVMINEATPTNTLVVSREIAVQFAATDNFGLNTIQAYIYESSLGSQSFAVQPRNPGDTLIDQAVFSPSLSQPFTHTFTDDLVDSTYYYLMVEALDVAGNQTVYQSPVFQYFDITPVDEDQVIVYPNPFNPDINDNLRVKFNFDYESEVTLYIYSLSGSLIYQSSDTFDSGKQEIVWNGLNSQDQPLGNGVYIGYLRIQSDSGSETRVLKIAVLK